MIDFRFFLESPVLYRLFQGLAGADYFSRIYANEYVKANSGDRILDIGCGPADILRYLPKVEYVGFDLNKAYIDYAAKKYSEASFYCRKIDIQMIEEFGWENSFDIVLANGVIHHLNENEALELLELSRLALKPGGRLVTHDGVYIQDQSAISRYLWSIDRGRYVRTREKYIALASRVFKNVKTSIRYDLLRVPRHSLFMMECKM
ncbi:MAG: class I SAM-dependent methyltransferase [Desulfocucumaceae bacterium]